MWDGGFDAVKIGSDTALQCQPHRDASRTHHVQSRREIARGDRGPRSIFAVIWVNLAAEGARGAFNVNEDAPLAQNTPYTLPLP